MLAIRPATLADLDALIAIHISSWKTQFTPFLTVEQVKLKDLDPVSYSKVWRERFIHEEGQLRLTFMAELDGKPVAYISGHDTDQAGLVGLHQIVEMASSKKRNFAGKTLGI